ncbi:hypothetical protein B0H17DRAFT_1142428 [Mycena rosella]|uniref:Mitochondrial splicing suppressor 51-like C-terminal domain-containing protein n=1 Tax=Mycena rosella TaxID=1033263 RepID=A0AAD7CXH6_MYCRO|nr:hypothetical protein B0H17DRAFT_1142428 [Mycena rosella]
MLKDTEGQGLLGMQGGHLLLTSMRQAGMEESQANLFCGEGVIDQFAWTDIAYNAQGQFSDNFVLAQFGILGTSRKKVGYWAINSRAEGPAAPDEVVDAPWCQLTEAEGWRLKTEDIPSLALHNSDACPTFPPEFEETWKSYYQWRGLPITSPAAMLLHWPMSVYACLKELGLAPEGSTCLGSRKKLIVYYVGARVGLVLISYLDLVMFGANAAHSVKRAKARGLTQSPRPCVFEYTGPASGGSGTVRVYIDSDPAYYCPSRERSKHPDAIVALNAGLGSYLSWQPVIIRAFDFDIPFICTDYCEGSMAQVHLEPLQQVLTSTLPRPKDRLEMAYQAQIKKVIEEVKIVDVEKVCAALIRKLPPPKFNEFMKPGDRGGSSSLSPGACNACIQVITPVARGGERRVKASWALGQGGVEMRKFYLTLPLALEMAGIEIYIVPIFSDGDT